MKYSQLFVNTQKEAPKDAETINHKLLVQAGFVDQLMAGVFTYLPLGLRVLRKIENIVRDEMETIGGQEILMPILHPSEIWKKTGGWDSIDVLFKIKSRTDKEYALGQSEEEVVVPLVMSRVNTYRDLPIAVYQIHWKYRDELRAKSGILRGREFYMKDLYSFHENQEDFDRYYNSVKDSYKRIFEKLGLTVKITEASGGAFSKKISYEFMVLTDAGEDDILYCTNCDYCVNCEVAGDLIEGSKCKSCGHEGLKKARASEVGNVFDLGDKYGKDFDFTFSGRENEKKHPIIGCYGIGISRIMGVLVEKFHDERGITWPQNVAPFKVYLISIGKDKEALSLYDELESKGIEVFYDDRVNKNPGEKFADCDLMGIPYRVVLSTKLDEGMVELKKRRESDVKNIENDELGSILKGN